MAYSEPRENSQEYQMADRRPPPQDQPQPQTPPQWDPVEEGRLESEAYQKHRQRQRGGPVSEPR